MSKEQNLLVSSIVGASLFLLCFTSHARPVVEDLAAEHVVEVRMLLKRDFPADSIDVHVNKGVMQFAGFVETKAQYQTVQAVADKYALDYSIINNVEVLAFKNNQKDPVKLKREIKRTLRANQCPANDIDVQVRNGHVILSGFVNKNIQLSKVQGLVESVPGTLSVDNYLLYKQA